MECFSHHTAPAVAVCKHCGKAVCRSCVVDVAGVVGCSSQCANELSELDRLTREAKKHQQLWEVRPAISSSVITWAVIGAVFLGWGTYRSLKGPSVDWFSLLFGAACCGLGVFSYLREKRAAIPS